MKEVTESLLVLRDNLIKSHDFDEHTLDRLIETLEGKSIDEILTEYYRLNSEILGK
jgi:ribosomal protein L12E/L44/L45/RPP1/RPP2